MINTGCLAYHSEAAMSFCFAKTRRENPLLTIRFGFLLRKNKEDVMRYKISELAKLLGVSTNTVRRYEDMEREHGSG